MIEELNHCNGAVATHNDYIQLAHSENAKVPLKSKITSSVCVKKEGIEVKDMLGTIHYVPNGMVKCVKIDTVTGEGCGGTGITLGDGLIRWR